MKLIAPAYYPAFRCIAGACRHSCCIGWEIDVDEDTRDYYASIPGALGDKLENCIADEEDCSHFILAENERCPFLQQDGLCELICTLGEDSLCQICADHPRFYNEWADRTEVGLGLCCEAAARLIVCREEPFSLVTLEDDGVPEPIDAEEAALLHQRDLLISHASDRTQPLTERIHALAGQDAAPAEWARRLAALERLDPAWDAQLRILAALPAETTLLQDAAYAVPLEQLLCSFLYRHIPGALADGLADARAAFAAASVRIIAAIAEGHRREAGSLTPDDLADIARMYSAEIEYSEENVQAMLAYC